MEQIDGCFHGLGGFDDLWQEHLARSEQLADTGHAIHQGAVDDLERLAVILPKALQKIRLQSRSVTLHQRPLYPLLDGGKAAFAGIGGPDSSLRSVPPISWRVCENKFSLTLLRAGPLPLA